MVAPIDKVLPRLEHVKQRQQGQWSASSPCCGGRSRSKFSVRETPEGAVLLHCFGGCEVAEIVAALGLQMDELFPPREKTGKEPKRTAKLLTASQALDLLATEAMVAAVALSNAHHGVKLTEADLDRLRVAAGRIGWLRREAMHHA